MHISDMSSNILPHNLVASKPIMPILSKKIILGTVILLLTLSLLMAGSIRMLYTYRESTESLKNRYEAYNDLVSLLSLIKDIETARRGYFLMGDPAYLGPYYSALPKIEPLINSINLNAMTTPELRPALDELVPLINMKIELARESIDTMSEHERGSIRLEELSSEGKAIMDQLREKFDELLRLEGNNIVVLAQENRRIITSTFLVLVGGCTLGVILLVSLIVFLLREQLKRERFQLLSEHSREELALRVQELAERNERVQQLGIMTDMLQTSMDMDEAFAVMRQYLPRLFPKTSGALCLTSESRNLVEAKVLWGPDETTESMFAPVDCWALRRGQVYLSNLSNEDEVTCKHLKLGLSASSMCIPMMAQGESCGLLNLHFHEVREISNVEQQFVEACSEQIALAVSNLKLQQTLRNQATRDPLTGLYNRRFMEESLDRELLRAARNPSHSLGLMILDIDHFKKFNDTHGHAAGDAVIRDLGHFLHGIIRGSDIACRYGGEELVVILPEASKSDTMHRAEWIREKIHGLEIRHQNLTLKNLTLSIGVASYPDDGETVENLLKAADDALYRAKKAGRDRVMAAEAV